MTNFLTEVTHKIDRKLSSNRVERMLDKLSVRVVLGALVMLPATILTLLYLVMSINLMFQLGTEDFFKLLKINELVAFTIWNLIPFIGTLGIIGLWIRIFNKNSNLSIRLRKKVKIFLACGLAVSIFYGVIFVFLSSNSIIESLFFALLFFIPSLLGIMFISGTPSNTENSQILSQEG